jgi:hypothetical protein
MNGVDNAISLLKPMSHVRKMVESVVSPLKVFPRRFLFNITNIVRFIFYINRSSRKRLQLYDMRIVKFFNLGISNSLLVHF